ncbi:hypothetical protein [Nocardioides lianchengensis]|uniref:hypothetical protein n=1 Tax=Nocardioides lianchengensis TaxID=1045774 RepID=UPI0011137520|nr:hypothetical protein [Nocardioides lianchengensis]NYG09586.1 hypothetical protein [Nocardioides lianchengensis]
MPVTHLAGRSARIDVTLEGLTFTRSVAGAARRGVEPVQEVLWDDLVGAELVHTRKGRPVFRVLVVGARAGLPLREDPYALKLPRAADERAAELVEQVAREVAVRRRWREHAEDDEAGA